MKAQGEALGIVTAMNNGALKGRANLRRVARPFRASLFIFAPISQDFVLGYPSAAFQADVWCVPRFLPGAHPMAQSLSNILLHIVFSTKNRRPLIDISIEQELFKYLATACNTLYCPSHAIGCSDDHIHIACSLSRTISVSKLVQELKQDTSKWMKTKGPQYAAFSWQNGYGAFSIGQSQLEDLKRYIANQREHHRRITFQDEYRELLRRYNIAFDERYVWD